MTSKLSKQILCCAALLTTSLAEEWTPAIELADSFGSLPNINSTAQSDYLRGWSSEFKRIENLPNSEKVHRLAIPLFRATVKPLKNAEVAAVYLEAQRLMMECDHPSETLAKWLEEQRSLRIKQKEEDEKGIRRHEPSSDYDPSLVFLTISQIPTPESVAVLGRYLSDRRDEKDMEEFGGFFGGHFRYAAESLNDMGLKNAPTRQGSFSTDENYILKWQQWFAEVEAGTRSFSFYGSDVEYRLKERTDAAGRKHFETVTAAKEASKQSSTESNGAASVAPTSSVWKTVAFAISSLLLLLGAWLSLRKRQLAN